MKQRNRLSLISMLVGLAGISSLMAAPKMKQMVLWPAAEIEFKEVAPGTKRAVLWGNPETGAFGGLVKFAAGTMHNMHVHSSDAKLVVISGTLIYKADGKEHKLGAGSYLLIPGGKKHVTGTGADQEVFLCEEWSGKFDMQMMDEKKPMNVEMSKTQEIIWPAEKMNYKEVQPGIKQAVISGDPTKGAYTALTKFNPGLKFGLHYHTGDKKAVVIDGKMTIGDVNGEKTTAEKGSFGKVPAGMLHTTEIDEKAGALMFEKSSGKADSIVVEQKPEQKQ